MGTVNIIMLKSINCHLLQRSVDGFFAQTKGLMTTLATNLHGNLPLVNID